MKIIADTHVHVYTCHEPVSAMEALVSNLAGLAPDARRVGFMTERSGCFFFKNLRAGFTKLDGSHLEVAPCPEDGAVVLLDNGEPTLFLLAGRQFVSADRIEVLGLLSQGDMNAGMPTGDLVKAVRDAGGIPVLSWAPGKWTGGRGKIVRQIIESTEGGSLLIGDTAMRPQGGREPALMQLARERGIKVVAGSDPLPIEGDECYAGTYASLLDAEVDWDHPVRSFRKILVSDELRTQSAGKRCSYLKMAIRWFRNAVTSV